MASPKTEWSVGAFILMGFACALVLAFASTNSGDRMGGASYRVVANFTMEAVSGEYVLDHRRQPSRCGAEEAMAGFDDLGCGILLRGGIRPRQAQRAKKRQHEGHDPRCHQLVQSGSHVCNSVQGATLAPRSRLATLDDRFRDN